MYVPIPVVEFPKDKNFIEVRPTKWLGPGGTLHLIVLSRNTTRKWMDKDDDDDADIGFNKVETLLKNNKYPSSRERTDGRTQDLLGCHLWY